MVKRVISVAIGLRSHTIARLPIFKASIAEMPLPAKGSNTIPPSGQYVLMNSDTTFHVLRDQYLCHKYIDVCANGGICLLRWLSFGLLILGIAILEEDILVLFFFKIFYNPPCYFKGNCDPHKFNVFQPFNFRHFCKALPHHPL